ncbi:MAG: hypothetical protein H8E72_05390 [Candidatus Marinimicrobia bacterium]|nr:hypothetical protein [Candidatus Neomarinimicrobiota bacterium]
MHQKIKFIYTLLFVSLFFAAEQNFCNHCKQLITTQWIVFEESEYHSNCYESHIAPKCSLCLEILTGKYLVDAWGNPFHTSHEAEGIYCSSCSRIISEGVTQGGYKLDDGRFLCSLCQSNIVLSKSQIDISKLKVLSLLQKIGIDGIEKDIPIYLANRFTLQKLADEIVSTHLKGFTKFSYIKSPFGNFASEYKIYILDRLPTIEFEAVLAHEYLHVWLYENNIDLAPAQREGFCNLASAYIYEENGSEFSHIHLNSMDADADPNYGDGYRKMKLKLEKNGWKSLLQTVRE